MRGQLRGSTAAPLSTRSSKGRSRKKKVSEVDALLAEVASLTKAVARRPEDTLTSSTSSPSPSSDGDDSPSSRGYASSLPRSRGGASAFPPRRREKFDATSSSYDAGLAATLWASHVGAVGAAETGGAVASDWDRIPLALACHRFSATPREELGHLAAWAPTLRGESLEELLSANASFRRIDLTGVTTAVSAAAAQRFGARARACESFAARGLDASVAPRWAAALGRSFSAIADVDLSHSPGMSDHGACELFFVRSYD